jgi:hypothetical protein
MHPRLVHLLTQSAELGTTDFSYFKQELVLPRMR